MRLFFVAALLLSLSCGDRSSRPSDRRRPVGIDLNSPQGRDRFLPCSSEGERDGPEVSITNRLDFVDASNAGNYLLKGRCSESRQAIRISVNDFPLKEYPICRYRRWELSLDLTTLDLTTIASKHEEIQFKVSHGTDSNVVCKEVKVAFKCPKNENYIPVPFLEDYYKTAFCVMKYEAKLRSKGDTKAVSVPEGKPIVSVSYQTARELCRNNGFRYDLISNNQWQIIARLIEKTDENWSSGRASRTTGNSLNCGATVGGLREASSNDEDSCGSSSCERGSWSYYWRTHVLPGGRILWDFCGNAGEMVKDKNETSYDFHDPVYLLKGRTKDRFGPEKTYLESDDSRSRHNREGRYWGLGVADLKRSGSLIIRGAQGRNAGIFSVNLDKDQEDGYPPFNTGFRCVYIP